MLLPLIHRTLDSPMEHGVQLRPTISEPLVDPTRIYILLVVLSILGSIAMTSPMLFIS